MIKRYNFRVYPNKKQQIYFSKIFGGCRFIYNWALGKKIEDYENKKGTKEKTLSIYDISKQMTQLKKIQEYEWLNEVPAISLVHSLNHLDLAYKNFFRRIKSGESPGFPKFKNRNDKKTFSFHQGYEINQDKNYITVPKAGKLKVRFHRRFEGEYKTSTISQEPSGKYFLSVVVDDGLPATELVELDKLVGVDHGVRKALTLSDGMVFKANLDFAKEERTLLKQQRNLSRKKKGSSNFRKNKIRVAKAHERIKFKREYLIKTLVHRFVLYLLENNYSGIVIRKYDVKGMTKKIEPKKEGDVYVRNGRELQKRMNKIVLNSSLGYVFEQLRNKLTENGLNFIEVDASEEKTTGKCSNCNSINVDIDLKLRIIECKNCGHNDDIDFNAAKNIVRNYQQSLIDTEVA